MDKKHIHVYYCASCKEGSTAMDLLYACVYCDARTPAFTLLKVLDQDQEMPVPFLTVPRGFSRVKRHRSWWKKLLFGAVLV
ncbi:MAG: hypothetical protein ACXVC1_09040 [Tumebacillaceae bacterium]